MTVAPLGPRMPGGGSKRAPWLRRTHEGTELRTTSAMEFAPVKTKKLIKQAGKLAKPFRVVDGESFRLKDIDPADTLEFDSEDKPRFQEALTMGIHALAELQDMLYAQNRWTVLLIFQAMDAAGKDGAIKHVMYGVNPQGCQVYSFKAP